MRHPLRSTALAIVTGGLLVSGCTSASEGTAVPAAAPSAAGQPTASSPSSVAAEDPTGGDEWVPSTENPDPSKDIEGISIVEFPAVSKHVRADQRVAYDRFPPIGGSHEGLWANCQGVAYSTPVRNENMVHALEHGAVWIAYDPAKVAGSELAVLEKLVVGQPYTLMSPYPGLDAPVSLQSWGHQLKVDTVSDERITQFITALRLNSNTFPEPGATCQSPSFDVTNPPPLVTEPPGADAVPMNADG